MHTWFTDRPVGEMRPGDHAWLPFSTAQEQEHIVGAFVYDGLITSEKVVYVGGTRQGVLPGVLNHRHLDPGRYVQTGQLSVISRGRACLTRGRLDPDRMLATFEREIGLAVEEGYRAVRFTTDLSWAARGPGGNGLVLECEARLEAAVNASAMAMVICQINPNSCIPDQISALSHTHEVRVTANPEFDDGTLRITRTFNPYGLRLEGELDKPRQTVFGETLHAVTRARRRAHLDFTHVHFVDLDVLTLLAAHALHLSSGQELVLDSIPPHIQDAIETLGWHRFPGIVPGQEAV
jgi:anti-anti-sigma regulatory factor